MTDTAEDYTDPATFYARQALLDALSGASTPWPSDLDREDEDA